MFIWTVNVKRCRIHMNMNMNKNKNCKNKKPHNLMLVDVTQCSDS